jgi:protein involved in sex pheromone biosynthesis
MSKFLRREKARGCPVHQVVLETAGAMLELHGVFSKEEVLEDTKMAAMGDAIRWDYVIEWLRDEQGVELVPVREAFFKRHSRERLERMPEKFLAAGHGVRTAGWASVSHGPNAPLVVKRLEQRKAMANGTGKKFHEFVASVRNHASNQVLDHPKYQKMLESKSA